METAAIVLATALGPITAVLVTLWHEGRKQRRNAKETLFVTLMASRKAIPIPVEFVRALNLIDVVFAGHSDVIRAWHELFDYLHTRPLDDRQVDHKKLNLLSHMARALRYKSLEQIDIDRFYHPEAHANDSIRNFELSTELLRVLKSTDRLSVVPRVEDKKTGTGN